VPEPFATVLLQATTQRDNLQTATNPRARWLFPGRRAGQPLHVGTLSQLVRDLGIPAVAGRTAALRQLVLQAPAPVVAQALGYNHNTHHPGRHRGRNTLEPLRELVLKMPPPIFAPSLGYSAEVTEERAEDTGRTWVTYASYRRARRTHPAADL
jgi:hypothetical protein